ncbi:1-phosphofructokinase [Tessaracoccus bendigoensis DSM 12906]|uniref:1-phosphofructokinase n=1 Tax=Tessaracoccus bendigoensis DSM 12906 TaxID=1123357 RepID=A0A1M6AAV9_9ACTN|nr:hexose kinase [Tessaracoccus bendigoensis]SHI33615.1 1-phosphofructokinase [Tessaracoccus bendigoensis DSM 12906]
MTDEVVTLTANPSVDRTIVLLDTLARGQVQRTPYVTEQAGGKGLNVARVLASAGRSVVAVAPAVDAVYRALAAEPPSGNLVAAVLPEGRRVRINTAITEPDGTTTKINEAGNELGAVDREATAELLAERAAGASWVVLSGSLPPGAPVDWYPQLAKGIDCKVAVDTSGPYLQAVVDALPQVKIDLLKPNSDELAELTSGDAAAFEEAAAQGDVGDIATAARRLVEAGVANVMVTLGGSGAVLVNADGAWFAHAPEIAVRSTVGAGDSSVAGFILADLRGEGPEGCLATAVAYGSAAAALPSTTLPTGADAQPLLPKVVAVGRTTVKQ